MVHATCTSAGGDAIQKVENSSMVRLFSIRAITSSILEKKPAPQTLPFLQVQVLKPPSQDCSVIAWFSRFNISDERRISNYEGTLN